MSWYKIFKSLKFDGNMIKCKGQKQAIAMTVLAIS